MSELKPKRLFFVLPSLKTGGAEKAMSFLLSELSRHARYECHLVLIHPREDESYSIPDRIRVHECRVSRLLWSIPTIIRLLWSWKPRVVVTTMSHVNVLFCLLTPLFPKGVALWIREADDPQENMERQKHPKLFRALIEKTFHRAERLICLNDDMMKKLAAMLPSCSENLMVIPNAVETCSQLADHPFSFFPGDGPHVLVLGRCDEKKRGDLCIEALDRWRDTHPSMQLYFVGDGPMRECWEDHARQLNLSKRVHFMGNQTNVRPYYQWADLLLFASEHEGLSNVLLEAVQAQVPVQVLKHEGGTRAFLESVGLGRCYVDSFDRPLLEQRDLADAARRCQERYGSERIVGQWMKTLDAIDDL